MNGIGGGGGSGSGSEGGEGDDSAVQPTNSENAAGSGASGNGDIASSNKGLLEASLTTDTSTTKQQQQQTHDTLETVLQCTDSSLNTVRAGLVKSRQSMAVARKRALQQKGKATGVSSAGVQKAYNDLKRKLGSTRLGSHRGQSPCKECKMDLRMLFSAVESAVGLLDTQAAREDSTLGTVEQLGEDVLRIREELLLAYTELRRRAVRARRDLPEGSMFLYRMHGLLGEAFCEDDLLATFPKGPLSSSSSSSSSFD